MGVSSWLVETVRNHDLARKGQVGELVAESIASKKFKVQNFSIAEAAEAAAGPAWQLALKRQAAMRPYTVGFVAESSEAIDMSAFNAVLGNIAIAEVMEGYNSNIGGIDDLFTPYATPNDVDVRTIAVEAAPTEKPQQIPPLGVYPSTGYQPYTITVPRPEKHGLYSAMPLELALQNRTPDLIQPFRRNGEQVALWKKKRMLRVLLGAVNPYTRNGTNYNTYLASGAWVNRIDDFNQANGPEEFDRFEKLWDVMVHPITGELIELNTNSLRIFVPRSNLIATKKNVNAQEIRDTNSNRTVITPNPVDGLTAPLTDRQARQVLINDVGLTATQADTVVLYGDFQRAFYNREVEPGLQTFEQDNELASEINFRQDIVYAVKCRVFHAPFVMDPFYVMMGRKMS